MAGSVLATCQAAVELSFAVKYGRSEFVASAFARRSTDLHRVFARLRRCPRPVARHRRRGAPRPRQAVRKVQTLGASV